MTGMLVERWVIRSAALALGLFHLYTAYFGTFYPFVQRSVPLMLAVVIVFLTIGASRRATPDRRAPWWDWLLAAAAIPAFGYIAWNSDYLANRWPMTRAFAPTEIELALGAVACLLLFEAARRTMGWVLVAVMATALAYALFGDRLGWGLLAHRGFVPMHVVDHLYLTIEGVWGTALGIAATYITLFVIFGAFMDKAGATDFFVDLANAIAGETRGGPAKVAVVSSGLIGSVTGSTVANVYTTGQLTIPLMKRIGYRPTFAGAVEALASNGGQLMPPVMGAAAFILAAYSAIPYHQVMTAAIIPAAIYFGLLIWYIHLEAARTGLRGLNPGEAPRLRDVLLRGAHLLLPLIVLVVLLARGFSPMPAGLYAILLMIVMSWIRPERRIGVRAFFEAVEKGARDSVMILVICAAVGIVIGTFTLTGLGLNAGRAIINLSGGNYVAMLVLVGVASIVLGTGLNTVAAFILVSIVAVPALQSQGVDRFVANMYVFYFSLLAHVTPPVCLAVFAGAAIAQADPWRTAAVTMRLGLVAYLLPFLVIMAPGLLLRGSPEEIVYDTVTTVAGAIFLVSAAQGWMVGRLRLAERCLAAAAAVGLLSHTMTGAAIGVALGAVSVGVSTMLARRERKPA